MAFREMGLIDFDEPFVKFFAHGHITKDGKKMSKSFGNVINPDLLYISFICVMDKLSIFALNGIFINNIIL
jgi:valyl-tRNA synthetase